MNLPACCQPLHGSALGNWYFPNATRVPSNMDHINKHLTWDIYRTRGQMVVYMHRRRGGEKGIYRCEIHDSMNVNQNIYIGVYTVGSGEWHCTLYTAVFMLPMSETNVMKVKVISSTQLPYVCFSFSLPACENLHTKIWHNSYGSNYHWSTKTWCLIHSLWTRPNFC